ncbi:MAG: hypothetical protein HKM04_06690 [Legionellales bacterium]|nr:hypothetical protein [Legionellales bacterium]
MDNSIFLAKAFGLYFLIVGLIMCIRGDRMRPAMIEFADHHGLFLFGAVITLILGIILVLSHNDWVKNWTVLVTIMSWIIFVSGISRLLFAECHQGMLRKMSNHAHFRLFGILPIILGIIFLYLGFCPSTM